MSYRENMKFLEVQKPKPQWKDVWQLLKGLTQPIRWILIIALWLLVYILNGWIYKRAKEIVYEYYIKAVYRDFILCLSVSVYFITHINDNA